MLFFIFTPKKMVLYTNERKKKDTQYLLATESSPKQIWWKLHTYYYATAFSSKRRRKGKPETASGNIFHQCLISFYTSCGQASCNEPTTCIVALLRLKHTSFTMPTKTHLHINISRPLLTVFAIQILLYITSHSLVTLPLVCLVAVWAHKMRSTCYLSCKQIYECESL